MVLVVIVVGGMAGMAVVVVTVVGGMAGMSVVVVMGRQVQ